MHPDQLTQILILLLAAVVAVAALRLLRLSPVLGYLAAGAIIGEHGLALITDTQVTSSFAEFGVIFLLFTIGLEVSLERLRAMRKQVFGFGSMQVITTALLIGAVVCLMGLPVEAAIIIGGGLALSSTAVVLQVVAESGEKSSQIGRLSLAVLLLQDLIVVPLLVLVPLLAQQADTIYTDIGFAILRGIVALVAIMVIGRLLLRPIFRIIAALHNADIFAATTLLIVLGIAWITQNLGLSLALGAFIGGLLVAETEYQHQVEADIMPYKGLFLGLFFISVGMRIDGMFILSHLTAIGGLVVALMLGKAAIIVLLCRMFGFGLGSAIHSGLLLSQGGEFAFILFDLSRQQGILPTETTNLLLVVVTVSMALTPLVAMLGKHLSAILETRSSPTPLRAASELHDVCNHVIIAGYGRMGQLVGQLLAAENIPYIAVDNSPEEVARARQRGEPVYFGDASRKTVLNGVGAPRARAIFITLKGEERLEKLIKLIRGRLPEIPIIARAKDTKQAALLKTAGANEAIPELFEGSLSLGAAVLGSLHIADHEIERIIGVFRDKHYV